MSGNRLIVKKLFTNHFFYFIILIISIILFTLQFHTADAQPPVFNTIVNPDTRYELDIELDPNNRNATYSELPFDILGTTYLSDGKTLNATIWLSDPIYKNKFADYLSRNLTYIMLISTDFADGDKKTEYEITIYPNKNGTWSKRMILYEPNLSHYDISAVPRNESFKTLQLESNYSSFYEDGQRYIDMSIPLSKIGLMDDHYTLTTISAVLVANNLYALDWGYDISVPLRTITYNWPFDFKLRAGDQQSKRTLINSSNLGVEEFHSLTDGNDDDGISIYFEPQNITIPKKGKTAINMTIKADKDAFRNTPAFINQTVIIKGVDKEGRKVFQNETFDIQILPPFSDVENIGNVLRNNNLTYIIPFGITSLFALWLYKRLPKKAHDTEQMSTNDLLTVDASIIAGVLIFLTVGASGVFTGTVIQQVGILTASIVFPFAIAAIITLNKRRVEEYGIKFMIVGFVYLMASIIVIAFIQF